MTAEAMPEMLPLKKPPGYREEGLPVQMPQPPKKPNLPPSFHPHKKRRSCCKTCCCCFSIFLLLFILLFISCGAFLYFWFQPKPPVFSLKSVQYNKFNVTPTREGPKLSIQGSINVEADNPNGEFKLVYGKTGVFLHDENGVNLGQQTLPGFVQGKKNITVLKFTLNANPLLSSNQATALIDGFKSKNLKIVAEVNSGIGIGFSSWNTGKAGVKVICRDMTLKQIENSAKPKCHINILDWINIS